MSSHDRAARDGRTSKKEMPPPVFSPKGKGTLLSDPQEREFLFRSFHDMRNPLHTILGYTSMVLRKTHDLLPEKQRENLEKVLQSADKLKDMLDQVIAHFRPDESGRP